MGQKYLNVPYLPSLVDPFQETAGHLVSQLLRRECTQHSCNKLRVPCVHENHRRDADFLQEMTRMLGLPSVWREVSSSERKEWLDRLREKPVADLSDIENLEGEEKE